MLTNHRIKTLQSLDKKKFRQKYNLFLVEGNKIIKELKNSSFKIENIYTTNREEIAFFEDITTEISYQELKKISFLQTPKDSVAVCQIKKQSYDENSKINLVLDGIQDPGNMGTMIRLADWFGIEQIICSHDTVDVFNPKVIQASMGSFLRVNVIYEDLEVFLSSSHHTNIGTDMDGINLYQEKFPEKFNLILGNEGNGMRLQVKKHLDKIITIPRFGKNQQTESLNVSMATGIILGNIFGNRN